MYSLLLYSRTKGVKQKYLLYIYLIGSVQTILTMTMFDAQLIGRTILLHSSASPYRTRVRILTELYIKILYQIQRLNMSQLYWLSAGLWVLILISSCTAPWWWSWCSPPQVTALLWLRLESARSTSSPWLSNNTESLPHNMYTTRLTAVQPGGSV